MFATTTTHVAAAFRRPSLPSDEYYSRLRGAARVCLGTATTVTTRVEGTSNRAVLFDGTLQHVAVQLRNSSAPWLAVQQLDLLGTEVHLGRGPLLLGLGVPALFFVPGWRRCVGTLVVYSYLGSFLRKLLQPFAQQLATTAAENNSVATKMLLSWWHRARRVLATLLRTVQLQRRRWLGGATSNLHYTLVLTDHNLAHSPLLHWCAKLVVTALMTNNAVLQTAALVGDVVSSSSSSSTTSTIKNNTGNLLASSAQTTRILTPGTPPPSEGTAKGPQQQQPPSVPTTTTARQRLTDVLSATAFEVRQPPTFLDRQNHVLFVSEAVLPQQAGRLEFQLRTTLTPGKRRGRAATGGGGVQWSQPEVRFDVTDAKQASRQFLPDLMTQLLPDEVWIPIGTNGVIIGGDDGNDDKASLEPPGSTTPHSSIDSIVTEAGQCQIQGRFCFFPPPLPPPLSSSTTRGTIQRWKK